MKINIVNTDYGFIPAGDDDYEKKRKLKRDEVYQVDIKTYRNYEFHKRYFKMLDVAWNIFGEKAQAFFGSQDSFRETLQMNAGHFELRYSLERKEWQQVPLSISYGKLTQEDFEELHDRVFDVIWGLLELKGIATDENYTLLRDF